MTNPEIEAAKQATSEFDKGYDARWFKRPIDEARSEAWKQGWQQADLELNGSRGRVNAGLSSAHPTRSLTR